MKYLICLLILAACSSRETNLKDLAERTEAKGKGVIIDIEPGTKK